MMNDVRRALREATLEIHGRLERRLDILGQARTRAGRRALTARFHRFHAEVEAAVEPWLSDTPGLDFQIRRRTPWLVRDLADLGLEPSGAVSMLGVGGQSEALGMMYVLEGSTLGGKVIRRGLEAAGQDMTGLSFLDPYGAAAGERWRGFQAVLDARIDGPEATAAAVAGAMAGFRHAERRLCEAAHV